MSTTAIVGTQTIFSDQTMKVPSDDEIRLFRLGGHNAEALATMLSARRLGVSVMSARELLSLYARAEGSR